jgi:hypothetical protein
VRVRSGNDIHMELPDLTSSLALEQKVSAIDDICGVPRRCACFVDTQYDVLLISLRVYVMNGFLSYSISVIG